MKKVLISYSTHVNSYKIVYDTKTNKFREINKILGGKSTDIEITKDDVLLKLSMNKPHHIIHNENLAKYLPEA